MPTSLHSSHEDGFSILEMIVAMTILALVLGIASQTVVLASRSISAAKEQTETARRIRSLMAEYDVDQSMNGDRAATKISSPNWVLKTRRVKDSNAELTALTLEKTGTISSKSIRPYLTFVPKPPANTP